MPDTQCEARIVNWTHRESRIPTPAPPFATHISIPSFLPLFPLPASVNRTRGMGHRHCAPSSLRPSLSYPVPRPSFLTAIGAQPPAICPWPAICDSPIHISVRLHVACTAPPDKHPHNDVNSPATKQGDPANPRNKGDV